MNIKEVVLDSYKTVLENSDLQVEAKLETEITRENGFDSLGFVSLIMEIEERISVDLDEALAKIRESKTLGQIVNIVENMYMEQNK